MAKISIAAVEPRIKSNLEARLKAAGITEEKAQREALAYKGIVVLEGEPTGQAAELVGMMQEAFNGLLDLAASKGADASAVKALRSGLLSRAFAIGAQTEGKVESLNLPVIEGEAKPKGEREVTDL